MLILKQALRVLSSLFLSEKRELWHWVLEISHEGNVDHYMENAAQEKLSDRISEISDALTYARDVVSFLSTDIDGDYLDDSRKIAAALLGDLETAETVENEADFEANIMSAIAYAVTLAATLQKAKAAARKEQAIIEIDLICEAQSALKQLRGELNDI